MNLIETEHLTKDYGKGRGIFDVSLAVKQGEIFGFLGPNGAGKTTTIRQLMGFIEKTVSGSGNRFRKIWDIFRGKPHSWMKCTDMNLSGLSET